MSRPCLDEAVGSAEWGGPALEPRWNRQGMADNQAHRVSVLVR
ncbi:MAG: hypothetical protein WB798_15620 [Nocardioidaceae bacterium]